MSNNNIIHYLNLKSTPYAPVDYLSSQYEKLVAELTKTVSPGSELYELEMAKLDDAYSALINKDAREVTDSTIDFNSLTPYDVLGLHEVELTDNQVATAYREAVRATQTVDLIDGVDVMTVLNEAFSKIKTPEDRKANSKSNILSKEESNYNMGIKPELRLFYEFGVTPLTNRKLLDSLYKKYVKEDSLTEERMDAYNRLTADDALSRYQAAIDFGSLNYFEILGVSPKDDEAQIKAVYRFSAKNLHPDVYPVEDHEGKEQAAKTMIIYNKAYEFLSEEERRLEYAKQFIKDVDTINIFKTLNQEGANKVRGKDIELVREISFETSLLGGEVLVTVPGRSKCTKCSGKGTISSGASSNCPTCNGTRKVTITTTTPLGDTHTQTKNCRDCYKQTNIAVVENCDACDGLGERELNYTVPVVVKPGTITGTILRVREQGHYHHTGPRGDLLVTIKVKESEIYQKDLDKPFNLIYNQDVTYSQLVLGHMFDIPLPDGGVQQVQMNPLSKDGVSIKIKGKGIPREEGLYGDLVVNFKLKMPTEVSAEMRELLIKLDEL